MAWKSEGMKKVVLKVQDKQELLYYLKEAKKKKLTTSLVTDAGHTFFDTHTTTCGAIGPDDEEKIDAVTGQLKMV